MIAVDTSVLIAILMGEPEKDAFIQAIASRSPASLSSVSLQEAGMIMHSRRGPDGVKDLIDIVAALRVRVAAYDEAQALLAIDAFANASMILSGMGPLEPLKTTGGKLFAGAYALYSGLVLVMASGVVLAPIVHRMFHRFHLEEDAGQ